MSQESNQESKLKRYVSQSIATEDEHKKQDTVPPEDPNPFTIRQFIHENVSQAVPVTPPPKEETAKKSAAKEEEPKKPLGERIKEAFKRGEEQVEVKDGKGETASKKEGTEGTVAKQETSQSTQSSPVI